MTATFDRQPTSSPEQRPGRLGDLYSRVLAQRALAGQEMHPERDDPYGELGCNMSSGPATMIELFANSIEVAMTNDHLPRPDHKIILDRLNIVALLESDMGASTSARDRQLLARYLTLAMGKLNNAIQQLSIDGSGVGHTWVKRYGLSDVTAKNEVQVAILLNQLRELQDSVNKSGILDRLPDANIPSSPTKVGQLYKELARARVVSDDNCSKFTIVYDSTTDIASQRAS